MNDYISREAARKELGRWIHFADRPRTWMNAIDKAIDIIDSLPAADVVEVRHARPVKFYSDPYADRLFTTCFACDGKIGPRDKWCKHCSARMDGGEPDAAD